MQSKSRSLLIALLAMFAVGAVAASAASASVVWTKAGTPIKTGTKVKVTIKTAGALRLEAPTENEIESCKKVVLKNGTISNNEIKSGVIVGVEEGTLEFSECTNVEHGAKCRWVEPVIFRGSTSLASQTVESKEEIDDVFWPEGFAELTPKKIEELGTTKAKEEQEKLHTYTKLEITGSECGIHTAEINGDFFDGQVVSDPESARSVDIDFPESPSEVTLVNGLKVAPKLRYLGTAAHMVGVLSLSFEEGVAALGVEKK